MDTLVKALAHQGAIRLIVVDATETVKEAVQKHQTYPTASAALGRSLSMAAIMGSMVKDENTKITLQINGEGPLGTILVDGNALGQVRGFVANPEVNLVHPVTHKLDVGSAVGKNGYLKVIKDLSMKDKFTGTVELQTGEIAEDFAYYFTVSEQTPSAVSLGVLVGEDNQVKAAGGILIQMMPFASEEDILIAEDVIKHLKPVSQLISEGMTPTEIAEALFQDVNIMSGTSVEFYCGCSKERMFEAITSLNKTEIVEMIEEDHGAEVSCHFCNSHYHFSEEELKSLVKHS